jgi:hypothetical protein
MSETLNTRPRDQSTSVPVSFSLCLEHVDHWERIASRRRPAFSSHLINALLVQVDSPSKAAQHKSGFPGLSPRGPTIIPSVKPIHSSRSSIAGSIDSARCAGIHVASSPSNNMARATPARTSGSRGVA